MIRGSDLLGIIIIIITYKKPHFTDPGLSKKKQIVRIPTKNKHESSCNTK
jgi:hypothetical protein